MGRCPTDSHKVGRLGSTPRSATLFAGEGLVCLTDPDKVGMLGSNPRPATRRCSSGLAIVSHKDEVVGSIPISAILEIAIDSNLILKHVITNVYCLFHLRRTIMFVMTSKELGYRGGHMALTLNPSELGVNESGWTIVGEVVEDWYEWVNEFEAYHPDFGWVRGNFEDEVTADSKQAFDHFYEHHPPSEWDYWDI